MESIYGTVGRKIRKLREMHGLTQQELAEKTGYSVPFMSLIETGRSKASFEAYYRIATQGFGIQMTELFKELQRPKGKRKPSIEGLNPKQKRLLDQFLRSLA